MWYAVEGGKVFEFSRRALRDAWVANGPSDVTASGYRAAATARDTIVRKADYKHDGDSEAWAFKARRRVDASPALAPHRELLVEYDWCNPDHARWVATAAEYEIVSWAIATAKAAN